MSLTYSYSFTAPAETSAEELEAFLKAVEVEAKALGFTPTTVLNVRFHMPDERDFSRRLGSSCVVVDERLKGDIILRDDLVWHHHRESGSARLIPKQGVILVITNEQGHEVCLGFMTYPAEIWDTSGTKIMDTPLGNQWQFSDYVQSPDPRYRRLVRLFAEAGHLASEFDDYGSGS